MKKLFMCLLAAAIISGAMTAFAQSIDPGTGVKLTLNKSYYPAWSPDGHWIASCGGFDGVWVTPASGGTSTKLIGPASDFMMTQKMGFTPDSREVIYTSYIIDPSRGTIVTAWKKASGSEILNEIPVLMAIDIQTKKTRVVREEALRGQYSKSGRYFAYINYDHRAVTDPPNAMHQYSLAVYDSLAGETRYLAEDLRKHIGGFSFSADESYIAAAVTDTTGHKRTDMMYMIPMNGETPKDITWKGNPWNFFYYSSPECSPDGRWILYTAYTEMDEKRMLLAYDTVSGKTTSVFPETTVWNTDATWSPDGKKFCCQLELKSSNTSALYVYDFNPADLGVKPEVAEVPLNIPRAYGKKLVDFSLDSISREDSAKYRAYANLRSEYSPVWSPDGRNIAFTTLFESSIWTVPAEGGVPTQVADYENAYDYKGYKITVDHIRLINYTPDGNGLVFPSWIIDENRGTVVTITEGTTPGGGYHFGCSISKPINVIKELNIDTGETRVALDSAGYPVYSHNGRYLAYTEESGSLTLLDIATGESKSFTAIKSRPFCFSPDDSSIIYGFSNIGLYRVALDGSPAEKLFGGYCSSADISPDGRLILFGGTFIGESGLFVYDFKSGKQYPFLINGDGFACSEGKFSPDGKKVCYTLEYSGDDRWTHSYVRDFNSSEFGISVTVAENRPSPFALTGNYPNPFNPSTTIGFSLKIPGRVHLAVYSLSGQKVCELIPGAFMQSGKYSTVWDGRDEGGRAVSTGVYFTRLIQGSQTVSRKMTLLK